MPQISYIKYKDILEARRIDAEYYKPEYLEIERIITSNIFKNLEEITNKIDVGFVGSMTKEYCENGILLLQTKNIEEFSINLSQTTFINERFHNILKKSTIKYGDILIARSGSFGKASIYMENEVCNSSDIIIVEGNNNYINNFYLVAFLNSSYGVGQLMKFASGGLQGHVNLTILESLKIPILSQPFQLKIEEIVKSAHKKQSESKQLYKEAEEILLDELGLLNYEVKHSLWFTSTKKEIDNANRYDSEYYQPKYEEIIKKIEDYEGGWDYAGKIVNWKKGIEVGTEAYTETGKDFVRVSDFSINGISETNRKISESAFVELQKNFQPKKGEILFTKDGTIGISYVLKEDVKGVLSGAFLRLTLNDKYHDFEKECLSLIFNSIICKMQVEKLSGGALIDHLKPSDFETFKIPLIKPEIQKKIAEKIQESHKLRKDSKELLELAKRAVEIAIEENEEVAMKYLEKKED